jgi:hypothetical protein
VPESFGRFIVGIRAAAFTDPMLEDRRVFQRVNRAL